MPQPYEFDLLHADGIRHADLDAGVRVLNELIFECQRRFEGIEHARLDLEARSWARGQGLRERLEAVFGTGSPLVSPALACRPTGANSCKPMDDRDGFQAATDELPAIGIGSL